MEYINYFFLHSINFCYLFLSYFKFFIFPFFILIIASLHSYRVVFVSILNLFLFLLSSLERTLRHHTFSNSRNLVSSLSPISGASQLNIDLPKSQISSYLPTSISNAYLDNFDFSIPPLSFDTSSNQNLGVSAQTVDVARSRDVTPRTVSVSLFRSRGRKKVLESVCVSERDRETERQRDRERERRERERTRQRQKE